MSKAESEVITRVTHGTTTSYDSYLCRIISTDTVAYLDTDRIMKLLDRRALTNKIYLGLHLLIR